MSLKESDEENKSTKLASSNELNSWKRGFTPQAEIWNGRMAIAGLIIVLIILLASNLFFSGLKKVYFKLIYSLKFLVVILLI